MTWTELWTSKWTVSNLNWNELQLLKQIWIKTDLCVFSHCDLIPCYIFLYSYSKILVSFSWSKFKSKTVFNSTCFIMVLSKGEYLSNRCSISSSIECRMAITLLLYTFASLSSVCTGKKDGRAFFGQAPARKKWSQKNKKEWERIYFKCEERG